MVPLKGSIAKTHHCLNKIAGETAWARARAPTQTEAFLSYLQEYYMKPEVVPAEKLALEVPAAFAVIQRKAWSDWSGGLTSWTACRRSACRCTTSRRVRGRPVDGGPRGEWLEGFHIRTAGQEQSKKQISRNSARNGQAQETV